MCHLWAKLHARPPSVEAMEAQVQAKQRTQEENVQAAAAAVMAPPPVQEPQRAAHAAILAQVHTDEDEDIVFENRPQMWASTLGRSEEPARSSVGGRKEKGAGKGGAAGSKKRSRPQDGPSVVGGTTVASSVVSVSSG